MSEGNGNGKSKLIGQVLTGVVLWFREDKGFGFVCPDGYEPKTGMDIFVHYSSIVSKSPRRNLQPDQRVRFEAVGDKNGRVMATNVEVTG